MAQSPAVDRQVPADRQVPPKVKSRAPSKLRPEIVEALKEVDRPLPAVVDPWDRARKAHEMLLMGKGWEEICVRHGFPSTAQAALELRGYLSYVHTMTGDEEREVAKRLMLDQLDMLWDAWAAKGTVTHDKEAAAILLRIMERKARLMNLEDTSGAAGTVQTFIISDGVEMANQLRDIADRAVALAGRPQDDVVEGEVVD